MTDGGPSRRIGECQRHRVCRDSDPRLNGATERAAVRADPAQLSVAIAFAPRASAEPASALAIGAATPVGAVAGPERELAAARVASAIRAA